MTVWVDVKNWLPEPYEDVLVRVKSKTGDGYDVRVVVGYYTDEFEGADEQWHLLVPDGEELSSMYLKNVTHWTLLPSGKI